MTLTRAQVRELDRRAIEEYGITGVVLMENAGRGVVDVINQLKIHGPVHVICGKGNNGGDGFVIARHLNARTIPVIIHLCCKIDELAGDAAINYHVIENAGLTIIPFTSCSLLSQQLVQANWIIDALLGTGLSGTVRPPYDKIIQCINASGKPVLAVDLPSGMDADTGHPLGACVKATQTVTFVALKQGFTNPAATALTGQIHIADIGVPHKLIVEFGVSHIQT